MIINENINKYLVPKSKEQIKNGIEEKFQVSKIRKLLEKYNTQLKCVYNYAGESSENYYSSDNEKIIGKFIDSLREYMEENWQLTTIIYVPSEGGKFIDSREAYGYEGLKILVEGHTYDDEPLNISFDTLNY